MSGDNETLIANAVIGGRLGPSGWVRVNCPLCGLVTGKDDRKQSLGYNVRTRGFNCFKCGSTGKLRTSPDEYDLPEDELEVEEAQPVEPPEGFYLLAGDTSMAFEQAREYLYSPTKLHGGEGRGLTEAQVAAAGIGGCLSGRFAGRVVVPVTDERGVWWWFVGRSWVKKAEKPYLYPSGIRKDLFYNERALWLETDEPVLVMEGCFDALSYWPNAVATLGKTTPAMLEKLATAKRPVVFCPDGDEWESGEMHCMTLRLEGQRAGAIRLPPRIDPDEVERALLRQVAIESLHV